MQPGVCTGSLSQLVIVAPKRMALYA